VRRRNEQIVRCTSYLRLAVRSKVRAARLDGTYQPGIYFTHVERAAHALTWGNDSSGFVAALFSFLTADHCKNLAHLALLLLHGSTSCISQSNQPCFKNGCLF